MVGTVAGIAVLAVFIFLLVRPAKPIKVGDISIEDLPEDI